MNDHFQFKETCNREISRQGTDPALQKLSSDWTTKAAEFNYPYHFEWLGRPIMRHPQDMVAMQQLIWEVQPDLVIETGIARGGSLIFAASLLELVARCGGNPHSKVLGIDTDIREHNRAAILAHPLATRIRMFQGSSISRTVVDEVYAFARDFSKVLVCLDSNHAHEYVLEELKLYAPLVNRGSYCVVFGARAADDATHPGSAVAEFLQSLQSSPTLGIDGAPLACQLDTHMAHRLLITAATHGFLQRI